MSTIMDALMNVVNQGILVSGTDPGNRGNKTTFVNKEGNLESFTYPTVIAEAPQSKVVVDAQIVEENMYADKKPTNDEDLELLHFTIKTNAVSMSKKTWSYYAGEYAKDKDGAREPNAKAQAKLKNELHIITSLLSLGIACLRMGIDKGETPLSIGLPIRERKDADQEMVIAAYKGTHEITFLDGFYEGRRVEFTITEGSVQVEGITSILGLSYDIKDGVIVPTKLKDELKIDFAIGDLGAGTFDKAFFDKDGLNKTISDNSEHGTNQYIDDLMNAIANLDEFKSIREKIKDSKLMKPYPTREEFMREVIYPEVDKMIEKKDYKPKFNVTWLWKNADVTDLVLQHMDAYAEKAIEELYEFWQKSRAKKFVLVGGGVLFGYNKLRHETEFLLPENIKDAPFITSKSYCIANAFKQIKKQQQ